MTHPLETRLHTLRRRVRRALTVYGLAWVLAVVVAALMVLGGIDYLARLEDRGLRIMASFALLCLTTWALVKFLVRTLRYELRDNQLALRVQRRFPDFNDRLVSAVEFLHQSEDDPAAGSATLRRAVIAEAETRAQDLDFNEVLDRRPVRRAVVLAVGVLAVAGAVVAMRPAVARAALARLANPWTDQRYPQRHHLAYRSRVERVARGQAFELEVIDGRGVHLPADIRIHYRFTGPDDRLQQETAPMRRVGESAVAVRENVVRPFAYRVEGGDDRSQPWIDVEVVDPPEIDALSIRLTPPAYTGWPPQASQRHIRALAGTRIDMEGDATRPLRSMAICLEGGAKLAGTLDAKGLHFRVPGPPAALRAERSGAYWFALEGRDGIAAPQDQRWELRVVPDRPPTITVEEPGGNVFVTPGATVPLRATARDDLAVHRVALAYTPPGEGAAPVEVALFTGPDRVAPRPASETAEEEEPVDVRPVEYRWDLAPLNLAPGTELTLEIAAADYLPQSAKSDPRRLIVVTPEDLQDRLAARQGQILEELKRVLETERMSRSQVDRLAIQQREVGGLSRLDVDHLQAAELNQRQVAEKLAASGEGAAAHVAGLLADLENNRLDSPDLQRRMETLLAEIERLDRDVLPVVARELTSAIKAAQIDLEKNGGEAPPSSPAVAASLASAGEGQDQVIASLEGMLQQLDQWDDYHRFHRDLGQLLREQKATAEQSTQLAQRTLTRPVEELSPQDRADLKKNARGQLDLARQLDRLEQAMEAEVGQLAQADPLAAETVGDALAESRRLAIAGAMRTASDRLQQNQMGQALSDQKQIAEGLQEVLDILAGKREQELARLVRKLTEAEAQLADLAQREGQMQQAMAQAAALTDSARRQQELARLADQQARLEEEAKQAAGQLERLEASAAAQTLQQATGQMGQAGQQARAGAGQQAGEKAGEAKKSVEQARAQLAQRKQEAQAQLAMERMAKLEDAIKHLRGQQQGVVDEAARLEGLLASQGQLTEGQRASVVELARQQRLIAGESRRAGKEAGEGGAFALVLDGAASAMDVAAGQFDRGDLGPAAVAPAREALTRLDLLLKALEPTPPEPGDEAQNTGAGGQGNQGPEGAAGGIQHVAELKALRLLQEEINQRTRALEQAAEGPAPLTPEKQAEYRRLGEEQGRLAMLVLRMLQPVEEPQPEEP